MTAPPAAGPAALLGSNVLIGLGTVDHMHHDAASQWMRGYRRAFATAPMTQVVRFLIRTGSSAIEAMEVLDSMNVRARHRFWPNAFPFSAPILEHVRGYAGVTGAYLAALARHHGGKVAALDRRLGDQHPDVALVVPT